MITNNILNLIRGEEGCRLKLYYDSLGKPTIGYGHLCGATENYTTITQQQADDIFRNDVANAEKDAVSIFPNLNTLSETRQGVLVSMSFELGKNRLLGFHHFINAVNIVNWSQAVSEMYDSVWAKQVPDRVEELANLLQRGEW